MTRLRMLGRRGKCALFFPQYGIFMPGEYAK